MFKASRKGMTIELLDAGIAGKRQAGRMLTAAERGAVLDIGCGQTLSYDGEQFVIAGEYKIVHQADAR
jgi:hypothetical protein